MKIGALEGGGTKMVCAVADENGNIESRISIPTKIPADTMPEMIKFYKDAGIEALGIGTFGPIDPNKSSKTYGYITSTPKLAWKDYNIVGEFEKALGVPIAFDTDVNAAALGEATYGDSKGLQNLVYVTIGTGIGAGVLVDGKLLHGNTHPEAGHLLVRRHPDDTYKGHCPYHGDCLEGMAAGPAIEERWGRPGKDLQDNRQVWEIEAYYIAQACVNYTLCYSPERIILGGGVMKQETLLPLVRDNFTQMLADYVQTAAVRSKDYIATPSLNDNQGVLGCVRLAL